MAINSKAAEPYVSDLLNWKPISKYRIDGPFSWTGNAGQSVTITYSYEDTQLYWSPAGLPISSVVKLTPGQQSAVDRAALAWNAVSGATYKSTDGVADLVVAEAQLEQIEPGAGGFFAPKPLISSTKIDRADLYLDTDLTAYNEGGVGFLTALHELGHALGISHPGGVANNKGYDNDVTIMSGNSGSVASAGITGRHAVTPMIYDIAAAQFLYGANRDDKSGSPYTLSAQDNQARTIWDAGGSDTLTVDKTDSKIAATLDLRGGLDPDGNPYWSHFGDDYLALAFDPENDSGVVEIEKAIGGAGNDTFYEGAVDSELIGNGGNDVFYGGSGNSIFRGGAEDDTFIIGDGADAIYGGEGIDTADFSLQKAPLTAAIRMMGGGGGNQIPDPPDWYAPPLKGDSKISVSGSDVSIIEVEHIIGSSFDDRFILTAVGMNNIHIDGGLGNDVFVSVFPYFLTSGTSDTRLQGLGVEASTSVITDIDGRLTIEFQPNSQPGSSYDGKHIVKYHNIEYHNPSIFDGRRLISWIDAEIESIYSLDLNYSGTARDWRGKYGNQEWEFNVNGTSKNNNTPVPAGASSIWHLDDATLFVIFDEMQDYITIFNSRPGIGDGRDLSPVGRISGVAGDVSVQGAGNALQFEYTPALDATVPCFMEGTHIHTPNGAVAVECLLEKQSVTLDRGGTAAILWIGQRRVDCRAHPKPEAVWPVRVRMGAFGDAVPNRDLRLSPDHAVFVNGVLIPVKCLINGISIVQEKMDSVTYYHVELPQHDVILAEGLPCESYLDTGDRSNFANGGGVVRLFPEFSSPSTNAMALWEALGCAPLVIYGPQLEAARAMVNSQLGRIGLTQKAG